jgi:hypothetical protein
MGQTTWVVLPAGRGGRVPDAQERLNQSFRLVRTFRRPRLDYDEFVLDVYRFMPREAR